MDADADPERPRQRRLLLLLLLGVRVVGARDYTVRPALRDLVEHGEIDLAHLFVERRGGLVRDDLGDDRGGTTWILP
jgi:hypothetical protein